MPRLKLACALALVASPALAQRDTASNRDSVRTFDPVIVSATRRDEHRSEAVISTAVVTRADIRDAGATDVASVLSQQLGLQLASGSPAGSQMLIQGLGDQRVLVLLDGQPLTGRVGGAFDLSRLPASIVERIEVVKGPQSVLYGTDAMGGVINIITRRPGSGSAHAMTAEASAIAGSHDRLDIGAHVGGRLASAPFGVDVAHNHVGLAPGLTSKVGAFADRWNVAPRIQLDASPSLRLEVGGLGVFEQQRYRTGQLFNFGDNTQSAAHVGAVWTHGATRLTPTIAFSGFEHLSRASTSSRPVSDSGARDVQRLLTGTLNYSGLVRGFVVDAGTELRHETISADRVPGARQTDAAAVFAQATWLANGVAIVPGARASWSEQWGTSVTPRVAAMFRPFGSEKPVTIRASVAGGFRSPDFKELYLRFVNAAAGYAVDGNAALRPEHSVNTSAEVEWAGRSSNLRASLFHNRIRDLIETVGPDAAGTYTYDNVGLATTAGAELELDHRIARAELGLGYSYLHTHDISLGGPILGRAAHSGRATVRVDAWQRIRLALTGLYTGDAPSARDDQGRVSQTRKAFTQANVRLTRAFVVAGTSTELSVGADNVFDAKQGTDWPGFTGRQFSVGLSWIAR